MTTPMSEHTQHYAPEASIRAVYAALQERQAQHLPLTVTELAAFDQFHTGGLAFTQRLAQLATITAADLVLDVGGGLGGPARALAQTFGCHVTVVDLTEAYMTLGAFLTVQAQLQDRVTFQVGDALDLPYPDDLCTVVWTQHSTMNIADKARLFAQLRRVLPPGGRLAFQEVVVGSGEPLHFPTMWAHTEAMNHLLTSQELKASLAAAGFREAAWRDITPAALTWFTEHPPQLAPSNPSSAPLTLPLLLGPDAGVMLRHHIQNLAEGRIRVIEGLFLADEALGSVGMV